MFYIIIAISLLIALALGFYCALKVNKRLEKTLS